MILDTECCLIVHISDLVCRGGCRVSLAGAAGILSREVTAVQLTSPSAHCAQAGCYNSPWYFVNGWEWRKTRGYQKCNNEEKATILLD